MKKTINFVLMLSAVALIASSFTFTIDKPNNSSPGMMTPTKDLFSVESCWRIYQPLKPDFALCCTTVTLSNKTGCTNLCCCVTWDCGGSYPSLCYSMWPNYMGSYDVSYSNCCPYSINVCCDDGSGCTSLSSCTGSMTPSSTPVVISCCHYSLTVQVVTDINGCWIVDVQ